MAVPINRTSFMNERVSASPTTPLLTTRPEDDDNPSSSKAFQSRLLGLLEQEWTSCEGPQAPTKDRFLDIIQILDSDGAALLGSVIEPSSFRQLVSSYEEIKSRAGSNSFLHTFFNLANQPSFLSDQAFNGAFLHPLLIALIAHRMGGAIRVSDARGKDTGPISVMAQDNMLHIDNTPFAGEYKVNLSWREHSIEGPSGQCFTFVPGTHKATRAVNIDTSGRKWATENGSIFTTEKAVDQLFAFQKNHLGRKPEVISARSEVALTILFDAGALVHHRFRTETGAPRSCVILAFHLARINPGRLYEADDIRPATTLLQLLLSYNGLDYESRFMDLLKGEATAISNALAKLADAESGTRLIDAGSLSLSNTALQEWRTAVASAPNPVDIKRTKGIRLKPQEFSDPQSLLESLSEVMSIEKYGRLDLILYQDGHEEVRKWARNRIREMGPEVIKSRLSRWIPKLVNLEVGASLVVPIELKKMMESMAEISAALQVDRFVLPEEERIAPGNALRSFRQLSGDLGEAILRCETIECFLATCLFMFWVVDDLVSMIPAEYAGKMRLDGLAAKLLKNYVASSLFVDMTQ